MPQSLRLCVPFGAPALAFVLSLLACGAAPAADPAKKPVSFINEVAPILKESCMGCHGAKNPKGKLDMTHYETFRKGGTKDDPIAPGKPDESYILDVLKAADSSRMPPKDTGEPLPPEKIAVIARWIAEGAKLDEGLTPKSDVQRELRLRWKPPAPPAAYAYPATVTALAFSPDGKKLVIGGHHELTVWDVDTMKLEKRIYTRARRTTALVFLPDGKLAVSGGRPGEEGDVRVYDIGGGKPRVENGVAVLDGVNDAAVMLKQLLDADDEVLCLALSADGKKLASGGCDRVVNVWDIGGGWQNAKLEQSIENHADWVFGVAFSPDGKHLITGSRDKTAKVWDLAAKESVLTFPDHQNGVYGVAIRTDGKTGYSVGEDGQLRAWNAAGDQAGKQVRNAGQGKAAFKVVAPAKQPWLVTCGADSAVRLLTADNFKTLKTFNGHTDYVYALAVSPDGNLIASGSFNGEVKIWKPNEDKAFRSFNASPGWHAAVPAAKK
jgi:WD40 repeat protein